MKPDSLRLTGANALELHALEWSREGVTLALVHGFANEAHIWDDFAPQVAAFYRVVALDLRGHGDSEWDPERRYDYDDHVADLEAVIDGLGAERVILVGHSLGGRISMLYASRHAEKMAGLVLVDSAPDLDPRGIARITLDVGQNRDPSFASVEEYERMLTHSYPVADPAALRRMAVHSLRQREDGRYIFKMDPALREFGNRRPDADDVTDAESANSERLWRALEAISCPTLVVRGAASDFVSPDVAERMAEEALTNGQLTVVPQSAHSVMTDNPAGFSEAVCDFVLGA